MWASIFKITQSGPPRERHTLKKQAFPNVAYEYNPQSARFDIPNPHRVENVFLTLCALVCFAAALLLLFDSRGMYLRHDFVRFAKATISALGLLALTVTYAFLCMRQLRFFFGRGQPADLVPSLQADDRGYRAANRTDRQIPDAAALRQTLQQNAISYRVPRGPIDNLLYSLVRDLVYSPQLTQTRVQAQFRNLLEIAFLLVLFPISLVGIHNPAAVGWIGCFYFLLMNALVLSPFATGRLAATRFSEQTVLAFVSLAIVAPVVLASFVPPNAYSLRGVIDVIPVTFLGLSVALVVMGLLFKAGISNTIKPTQIAIAPHLETPSVNTTPAQLYTELARELQRLWVEQVPNRTYMRILPDVSGPQGAFSAHVIEETQPLPVDAEQMTFARAFALATTCWLVIADIVCTALTAIGSALVVWGATAPSAYTAIAAGGTLVVIAAFGIRSANAFWRRFEFASRIYWVDWNGNYTRSATKIGALLTDRIHTEREVVNVESMTLRVWVADIDSVAFNTDQDRDIVAIRGLPDEATRLGEWLAAFAKDQSIITAPMSVEDHKRLGLLNALNDSGQPAALGNLPQAAAIAGLGAGSGSHRAFCSACGAAAGDTAAVFCGNCGARLT
jgi:hypothetical protein